MTRNEALLIEALGRFVDQYCRDRATWPDDMVEILDNAHRVVAEVSGLPRNDYGEHVPADIAVAGTEKQVSQGPDYHGRSQMRRTS